MQIRIAVLAAVAIATVCAGRQGAAQEPETPLPAYQSCRVERVVDGDTLYCADGPKVRLLGVDAPERGQRPFGADASAALRRLVPQGTTVRLETDVRTTDRYGRTLAWVWRGDRLVNEEMTAAGWVVLYTVPPNVRFSDRIAAAQRRARERRAGLWASSGFDCLPRDYRRRLC
jgi:micrococcal nuclease